MPTPAAPHGIHSLAWSDAEVDITWQDGHRSRFPAVWLLHACDCDRCGSTETGVRHGSFAGAARIEEGEVRGDLLRIDWGGGHSAGFSGTWLRAHCLSAEARAERARRPVPWGSEFEGNIPAFEFDQVVDHPATHLRFLESVRDLGVALVGGVPTDSGQTVRIAEKLVGHPRLINYGIYELEAKPNPEITGDMAVSLTPHTDEMYRIDPPAITLFHVIAPAVEGGTSTLVDGLRLAVEMARDQPAAFETLCTVPARFHRRLREGWHFDLRAPVFRRDRRGVVTGIRMNDRCLAPVDAEPDDVVRFYEAVRLLMERIKSGDGMVTIHLEAGQMLVFDNQRLLHGRTSFDPSSGRYIRIIHVDHDEFYSRLREALHAVDAPDQWMELGPAATA